VGGVYFRFLLGGVPLLLEGGELLLAAVGGLGLEERLGDASPFCLGPPKFKRSKVLPPVPFPGGRGVGGFGELLLAGDLGGGGDEGMLHQ
jgi:hypothetical protein